MAASTNQQSDPKRDLKNDPKRDPTRDPTHDPTLGDPIQPARGMLVLNTSRIRDFVTCPRRFFLAHVLRLPSDASDPSGAGATGSAVHAELRARHQPGVDHPNHDVAHPIDETIALDDQAMSLVRAHNSLCPRKEATYVDGEVDLSWYIPRKSVLVTGRVDALWQFPDGTMEVRDYKTGACPTSLGDDIGAAIYLLLAINLPQKPTRVRIVYESLRGETPTTVELTATNDDVAAAYANVLNMAEHIRRERTFPATPNTIACRSCGYRALCPFSVATADDER
jgi:CRISPR/Cas system-associated exonuclease Cas4 (RecB family)